MDYKNVDVRNQIAQSIEKSLKQCERINKQIQLAAALIYEELQAAFNQMIETGSAMIITVYEPLQDLVEKLAAEAVKVVSIKQLKKPFSKPPTRIGITHSPYKRKTHFYTIRSTL